MNIETNEQTYYYKLIGEGGKSPRSHRWIIRLTKREAFTFNYAFSLNGVRLKYVTV